MCVPPPVCTQSQGPKKLVGFSLCRFKPSDRHDAVPFSRAPQARLDPQPGPDLQYPKQAHQWYLAFSQNKTEVSRIFLNK